MGSASKTVKKKLEGGEFKEIKSNRNKITLRKEKRIDAMEPFQAWQ